MHKHRWAQKLGWTTVCHQFLYVFNIWKIISFYLCSGHIIQHLCFAVQSSCLLAFLIDIFLMIQMTYTHDPHHVILFMMFHLYIYSCTIHSVSVGRWVYYSLYNTSSYSNTGLTCLFGRWRGQTWAWWMHGTGSPDSEWTLIWILIQNSKHIKPELRHIPGYQTGSNDDLKHLFNNGKSYFIMCMLFSPIQYIALYCIVIFTTAINFK